MPSKLPISKHPTIGAAWGKYHWENSIPEWTEKVSFPLNHISCVLNRIIFTDPAILDRVLQNKLILNDRMVEAKRTLSKEKQQTNANMSKIPTCPKCQHVIDNSDVLPKNWTRQERWGVCNIKTSPWLSAITVHTRWVEIFTLLLALVFECYYCRWTLMMI